MDSQRSAFIAVNPQEDMMPEGALGAPGSDRALKGIMAYWDADLWIVSQRIYQPDQNPRNVNIPPHCIKGTRGAKIVPELKRKVGANAYVTTTEGYSAFEGGTLRPIKKLEDILLDEDIGIVLIGGYYLEAQVAQTAFDANSMGFATKVLLHATASRYSERKQQEFQEKLENAGVSIVP